MPDPPAAPVFQPAGERRSTLDCQPTGRACDLDAAKVVRSRLDPVCVRSIPAIARAWCDQWRCLLRSAQPSSREQFWPAASRVEDLLWACFEALAQELLVARERIVPVLFSRVLRIPPASGSHFFRPMLAGERMADSLSRQIVRLVGHSRFARPAFPAAANGLSRQRQHRAEFRLSKEVVDIAATESAFP